MNKIGGSIILFGLNNNEHGRESNCETDCEVIMKMMSTE